MKADVERERGIAESYRCLEAMYPVLVYCDMRSMTLVLLGNIEDLNVDEFFRGLEGP